ncbi:MAG: diguanylate cyclase (GGDEF)-like protein/PAS domain S-box-containing protein [Motiliproteus sp.]|jgi:diguanylate cyclase (GGDEF)-like protein/PAS domain S-box-containing protein
MSTLHQNLNILFIGADTQVSEPILTLLRSARLTPKTESVHTETQLKQAFSAGHWDIILYRQGIELPLKTLATTLKAYKKDIPVLVMAPDATSAYRIQGLKMKACEVVPIDQTEMLVLIIRRELDHLENRRRRRMTEFHLLEAEKRNRQLLQASGEATAFFNRNNEFIYLNPVLLEMLGFEQSSQALGQSLTSLVSKQELADLKAKLKAYHADNSISQEIELIINRVDGSEFSAKLVFSPARFERAICTQLLIKVSREDAQMESMAELDLVTGLKNQFYLAKRLDQTVQDAARADLKTNLLYISLDNFNAIKAEIGVNGIDAVVRDTAAILGNLVNRAHVLCRYNLDAFVVIYSDPDSSKAVKLAEQICTEVGNSLSEAAGAQFQTTCSIGVTAINEDSISAQDTLRLAQIACDEVRSKNAKGNGVHLYTPDSNQEQGLSIRKLRQAIRDDDFKLLFQPLVSLKGNHDSVYEVLLRLIDKDNKEVSPNNFLSMLDHVEVSTELDRWVIAESIRQLAEEHKKGRNNRLFINLSGRSLEDPRLLHEIRDQLKEHQVPGDSLVFQFSESDAWAYIKYANIFTQGLAQLHASACIKHYGSSIDSENVLRHVPAKYIKLDGSFVQELIDPDKHEAFDKLIEPLRIGQKSIVAPLVEGTNVMSKLFRAGVQYIQGYYLQAPREKMDYDFFNDS